jgi:hypothetical protein
MSNWNGKGSNSRVSNYNSYYNCPLWENKNKKHMKEYKFRSNKVILQGDTHCNDVIYNTIVERLPDNSDYIQIGDGGFGFGNPSYALCNAKSWLSRIDNVCKSLNINCYLIRGNHDNPEVWKLPPIYSNIILVNSGDVGVFPNGKRSLFVGGGVSVDRFTRTVNDTYWVDEITENLENVPECDIIFSHDCPEYFNHSTHSLYKHYNWYCDRDVTLIDDCVKQRNNMSNIAKLSKATTIFSGHFHNNMRQQIDGVYYRCLDINEQFEFDSETPYTL